MSIEELKTKTDLMRFVRESLEGEPLPQVAVEGLQQAVTPGKWEPLILENGWSNFGAPYSVAAWRTIPGGGVQLRGVVTKAEGANGTVVCTLPASLRPTNSLVFSDTGNLQVGQLILNNAGGLVFFGPAAAVATLANVIYWPGS